MTTFDAMEYERWLRASSDEEEQARILFERGRHHGAVLHCEQAVQLALKGLLRGVGVSERGHGLRSLADACREQAGLAVDGALRESLGVLERDYQPTRYPDAVGEGTPRENYGAGDSRRAFDVLASIQRAVGAAWRELQEAAAQDEPGEPR